MNFAVPADHIEKIKESEKIDHNLDLARELKKVWKKKVTVIPIVAGTLGIAIKDLERKVEN